MPICEMTVKVQNRPEEAAAELRALIGPPRYMTADQVAARYGVFRSTALRWVERLRAKLGKERAELSFRMGTSVRKPKKKAGSGKRRGRPKKVVAK